MSIMDVIREIAWRRWKRSPQRQIERLNFASSIHDEQIQALMNQQRDFINSFEPRLKELERLLIDKQTSYTLPPHQHLTKVPTMRFGRSPLVDPFEFVDGYTDADLIGAIEPVIRCLRDTVATLKEAVNQNPAFYANLWQVAKDRGPKMFIRAAMSGVNFEAMNYQDFAELFSSPALERLLQVAKSCIESQNEVTNGAA